MVKTVEMMIVVRYFPCVYRLEKDVLFVELMLQVFDDVLELYLNDDEMLIDITPLYLHQYAAENLLHSAMNVMVFRFVMLENVR
jgi:hypothetical protein